MLKLTNNHLQSTIKDYLNSYLKSKPPDCILYSDDGTKFKTHKELFSQTILMREILKSANAHYCCNSIEIICPCSKEELNSLIEFLNHGRIYCSKRMDALKILENLNKILGFGFPETFSDDNQKENNAFSKYTITEHEPFEMISDVSIFVVPTKEFKRETAEKEFDAGMAVLNEMNHRESTYWSPQWQ